MGTNIATWGVVMSMLTAGCGGQTNGSHGGGTGESCDFTTACGGDLTGTWTFQAECLTGAMASMSSSCPSISETVSASINGTVTFEPSGTYSLSDFITASVEIDIPGSCLTTISSCDALQSALQSSAASMGLSGATSSCTGSISTRCSCTLTESRATDESGTYSISGGTLTRMSSGGTGTVSYCVTGNDLRWQSNNVDGTIVTVALSR